MLLYSKFIGSIFIVFCAEHTRKWWLYSNFKYVYFLVLFVLLVLWVFVFDVDAKTTSTSNLDLLNDAKTTSNHFVTKNSYLMYVCAEIISRNRQDRGSSMIGHIMCLRWSVVRVYAQRKVSSLLFCARLMTSWKLVLTVLGNCYFLMRCYCND